jgi:hypothetical protein
MFVSSSGNVGIGTTTPASKLHIGPSIGTLSTGLTFGDGTSGIWQLNTTALNIKINNQDRFWFRSSDFYPDATEAISLGLSTRKWSAFYSKTITDNGSNFLVGTTTDSGYKLDVNGTANVSSTLTTANVRSNSDLAHDVGSVGIRYNAVYTRLIGSGNSVFSIFNNTGTSIHIPSTNNVLIGTTTDSGYKLDVSGSARIVSDALINGVTAGRGNSSINTNTAFGFQTLISNTTATSNTGVGFQSLATTTIGSNNTAIGSGAMRDNLSGTGNTALGVSSLLVSTGNNNTAIGYNAGNANTTGTNNIFIGFGAVGASITDSNRTWIGNSSTTSTWLAGNVLIGTTTDAGYKLDVNGTSRFVSSFRCEGQATFISAIIATAQVRIGSNPIAASSVLDVQSTTQGFLPPRMTLAQRTAISSPAVGLIVYETGSVTSEGLWLNETTGWQQLLTNSGSQSISGSLNVTSLKIGRAHV